MRLLIGFDCLAAAVVIKLTLVRPFCEVTRAGLRRKSQASGVRHLGQNAVATGLPANIESMRTVRCVTAPTEAAWRQCRAARPTFASIRPVASANACGQGQTARLPRTTPCLSHQTFEELVPRTGVARVVWLGFLPQSAPPD